MESASLRFLLGLADRHQKTFTEVLTTYPAWEIPYWQVQCSKEVNQTGKSTEIILAQILSYLERYFTKSKRTIDDIIISEKWETPEKVMTEEENINQINAIFGNVNGK